MSGPSAPRDARLDLLRGVAVLAMFAVHAYRTQRAALPAGTLDEAVDLGLRALMQAEPWVAGTFLYASGRSLALRPAGEATTLLRAVLPRAAALWGIAVLLFVAQFGLLWPDLLLSPGVLSTIAAAMLLGSAALGSHRPRLVLGLSFAATLGLARALERFDAGWVGLNHGPGGMVPLVAFALAGAFVARHARARGLDVRRMELRLGLRLVAFSVGCLAWRTPLTSTHQLLYLSTTGNTAVLELLAPGPAAPLAPLSFWNHTAAGVLALLPMVLLAAALLPERRLPVLTLLGRHALAAYVLHLALLGGVELVGLSPRAPWQTALLVLLLTGLCTAAAYGLERRAAARAARATAVQPARG